MNPATYLALGDSYTIGEGIAADEGWPGQLVRRLRALGVEVAPPRIVATTGWTTDELSAAMDAAALDPPYDLVSLLIGVNNQYRGRTRENYRDEFARLLERACGLAARGAATTFVLSIPDWGVTRFARMQGRDAQRIADEIDAFNAAARTICSAAGVPFVDVTALSRDGGDGDSMLVADGLHPSAAQYALWTEATLPTVRAILAGA